MKLFEMWRADIRGDSFHGGCLAVWDMTPRLPAERPRRAVHERRRRRLSRSRRCCSTPTRWPPATSTTRSASSCRTPRSARASTSTRRRTARAPRAARPTRRPTARGCGCAPTTRWRRCPNDGARVVARAMQRYGMLLSDAGRVALTARSDRFTRDEVGGPPRRARPLGAPARATSRWSRPATASRSRTTACANPEGSGLEMTHFPTVLERRQFLKAGAALAAIGCAPGSRRRAAAPLAGPRLRPRAGGRRTGSTRGRSASSRTRAGTRSPPRRRPAPACATPASAWSATPGKRTARRSRARAGSETLEQAVEALASLPFVDVLYIRCDWRDVQSRPGRLDLHPVWAATRDAARRHGLRIAFRVQLSNPEIQPARLALPDFLQAKVPLVTIRSASGRGPERVEPRYDHPAFQRAFRELNELLAAELDHDPLVEFADLMMYGFWGEGHTSDYPSPIPDRGARRAHLPGHDRAAARRVAPRAAGGQHAARHQPHGQPQRARPRRARRRVAALRQRDPRRARADRGARASSAVARRGDGGRLPPPLPDGRRRVTVSTRPAWT